MKFDPFMYIFQNHIYTFQKRNVNFSFDKISSVKKIVVYNICGLKKYYSVG